jgi:AcrR family transcriptional regulator
MGMLETAARRRLGPQQRRSQLVAVGMTLLRDRPLGDLALEDVAAAAGISRALPYHYFGTRGEFLIAVLEATAGDFLQATDPAPELPPLERLRAGIGAYVDWVGARPSEFLALTRSAAGAGPALRGVCERCRDALVDRLTLGMGADLASPPGGGTSRPGRPDRADLPGRRCRSEPPDPAGPDPAGPVPASPGRHRPRHPVRGHQ